MGVLQGWHSSPLRRGKPEGRLWHVRLACITLTFTVAMAGVGFGLHVNLATAGSLELLAVVLVALRWGFAHATVVSIVGVLCLDYFFTEPIFQLSVADPRNWVSLITLELTALLVSGLSTKVRLHATEAEEQRSRSVKLYELSRAILLIDSLSSVPEQLASLIREIIGVHEAIFWTLESSDRLKEGSSVDLAAFEIFSSGEDSDIPDKGVANRILRLGLNPIGAMIIRGDNDDPLLADAIASLAAIAIERAHSLQRENQAEAERNAEQLRTAVLDGLAHGFKTPLTAIQTASSGLLAIDNLSPPQLELVSIINERTSMLSQLCTRLLQTAALESREVRLRRKPTFMSELLRLLVDEQEEETQLRVDMDVPDGLARVNIDAQVVKLAIHQLIDNAAKYSDVGSRIQVTLRQTSEETIVLVENSGPSIDPGERDKLFKRFYRGSFAAHGPTGTGLGLSIVKKAAEAHGGTVRVESAAGKTRFTFILDISGKAM